MPQQLHNASVTYSKLRKVGELRNQIYKDALCLSSTSNLTVDIYREPGSSKAGLNEIFR